ncbi:MAG TPA: DNA-3-methyladenine glycosylase [Thermoanaerobaculia bacterium]|nr:DNA-3-methyladenine glycosylase [Thermoanaerobaculia bacterium]
MTPALLPRAFYMDETVAVARNLLGCILRRRVGRTLMAARIVETEAYLGANDPASHARRGLRSERNESMYLEGGHAYVYFTYGMHHCLNVVTQESEVAEAVLIRAAEPLAGLGRMQRNRPNARREHELMSGPGKLCMAMEIDRRLDGEPLDGRDLFITAREIGVEEAGIAVTPRVGIDGAGDAAHWPLRFFLAGSRHVSPHRIRG